MNYRDDDGGGYRPSNKPRERSFSDRDNGGHRHSQSGQTGKFVRARDDRPQENYGEAASRTDFQRRLGEEGAGQPVFWRTEWEVNDAIWTATHRASGLVSILEDRSIDTDSVTVTIKGRESVDASRFHVARLLGESVRIWLPPTRNQRR